MCSTFAAKALHTPSIFLGNKDCSAETYLTLVYNSSTAALLCTKSPPSYLTLQLRIIVLLEYSAEINSLTADLILKLSIYP